jgi:hypothetical protein
MRDSPNRETWARRELSSRCFSPLLCPLLVPDLEFASHQLCLVLEVKMEEMSGGGLRYGFVGGGSGDVDSKLCHQKRDTHVTLITCRLPSFHSSTSSIRQPVFHNRSI